MTQMSMFPVLFYLALQRNEFCLLLTVKNVFTLLFSLNWTFVPRCISGINHKVSSQLQVTLKMQQLSSWQADKAGITSPLCWRHQLPEKKWLWKSWRLFMKLCTIVEHHEPKPTNINIRLILIGLYYCEFPRCGTMNESLILLLIFVYIIFKKLNIRMEK